MHDYQSPDGTTLEWRDVMWFLQTSYLRRAWSGFYPLLFATGLCIEDPALLQDEKKLLTATREAMKQEVENLRQIPSPPSAMKKQIISAINRAWCSWLWRETGECPDCPIPFTVFIARVIEAMNADVDPWRQHDMLWRVYTEEQNETDAGIHFSEPV